MRWCRLVIAVLALLGFFGMFLTIGFSMPLSASCELVMALMYFLYLGSWVPEFSTISVACTLVEHGRGSLLLDRKGQGLSDNTGARVRPAQAWK